MFRTHCKISSLRIGRVTVSKVKNVETLGQLVHPLYVNTLPALLRSAASATTTSVLSVSPSGPPGPGALVSDGLPFGPLVGTAALSSSSLSPTPINSLLYADDVALVGSASEVRHMLDLAQIHSLTLGYKWSPPKCAVLNATSPSSSRYVQMSLYGQDLPTAEEFTYLGYLGGYGSTSLYGS
ncbi:hypothetical protein G6F38_013639 [Rhizopus arrhizus]|nr:hypothetical protein G6F38_013639 [Rhizopus arrhizus]